MESLGALIGRIEQFATTVARRTRIWALIVMAAVVAAWIVGVGDRIPESPGVAVAWAIPALAALLPGLILLGFAKRARRLAALPDQIERELGVVTERAGDVVQGQVRQGLGGLRSLTGSLRELRGHGDEAASVVAAAAGTIRMVHPLYLGMVTLAAGATALIVAVAVTVILVVLL